MKKVYKNKQELIQDLILPNDVVLDVGFWGQGVTSNDPNWPHKLINNRSKEVYGLDLDFNEKIFDEKRYFKASAENFDSPIKFDVIFAGDLIEHLSNPGLFLDSCTRNLKPNGRLILTTPNCFSLFSITEKITKFEPTVNKDHTCYFNLKTLAQLLGKNGFEVESHSYIYSLDVNHKESWKKKIINIFYRMLSFFTPKFMETIVIIAKVK